MNSKKFLIWLALCGIIAGYNSKSFLGVWEVDAEKTIAQYDKVPVGI